MDVYRIAWIGLVAGAIGTGLGGAITVLLGRPGNRVLSFVLGFSGGIMLAIIFSDLIPEGFAISGPGIPFIGLVLGVVLILGLDIVLPHFHLFSEETERSRYLKTGLVLGLGITMHNLPEGLAIGTGYVVSELTGASLVLAMVVQNIPEGMAMAAPLVVAAVPAGKCVLMTVLAGVPMGLGAFLGAKFGAISPLSLSLSLGFAAGAMLYIVFDELLPAAQDLSEGRQEGTFGAVAGVIVGLALLNFLG
ncbi:MAG: ZIP family metal transporter [Firmicutes bacterium]|nr:ZIP family metal transporter [Bacillota bacterium]